MSRPTPIPPADPYAALLAGADLSHGAADTIVVPV